MRGIKLLSFCHLKLPNNGIASEDDEKIWETCKPRGKFKHRYAIGSLPTLQISLGIIALFEKIYDGQPILIIISNIGEDVHCTILMFQCKCMM